MEGWIILLLSLPGIEVGGEDIAAKRDYISWKI